MLKTIQTWLNDYKISRQKTRLQDPAYNYLFDKPESECYVCFDCETTGLDCKNDRIITLSAIKIVNNEVLTSQSLNLLIQQDQNISEQSIVIHQIRNIDIANSKQVYATEQQAIEVFLEFIGGATLVGYYLDFDIAMVNRVIKPWLGIELPNPKLEVANLYYQYAREQNRRSCIEPNIDLGFESILKTLDIPNLGQHDAFNDALMTALVFLKLKQNLKL